MNLREQLLIIEALHMLENICFTDEVMESEMAETPVTDEIEALVAKIEAMPIGVPLNDLPEHLLKAIDNRRWDIWESDPKEHTVGESEDDSVMGSWIGYPLVQEIDDWLTGQGINYAVFTTE